VSKVSQLLGAEGTGPDRKRPGPEARAAVIAGFETRTYAGAFGAQSGW
jgi:hypothetical protein